MCLNYNAMQTNTNDMAAEKSLEIIQNMVLTTRKNIRVSGFHFLLWGGLAMMASLVCYFFMIQQLEAWIPYPWAAMTLIGIPVAIAYEWKKDKTKVVHTLLEKYYSRTWAGFGASLFCVIFFCAGNEISPVSPILALIGMATFVSGSILDFKPLMWGAVFFWLTALAVVWITGPAQFLLYAAAIGLGYLIPGFMMYHKDSADV